MPKPTLRPGLKHSETITVTDRLIVPEMADFFSNFAAMPPVLATAYLVAFVEWTCVRSLADHLLPGEHTVGTHVDLSHTAATPVGMSATAEVELLAVEGRKLRFKVTCRDARDAISNGFHERTVIDEARFLARLAQKQAPKAWAAIPGIAAPPRRGAWPSVPRLRHDAQVGPQRLPAVGKLLLRLLVRD